MSAAAVTTHDLERGLGNLRDELRGEMHVIRDELRGEMHVIRDELRGEMKAMKTELRDEMKAMKTELRDEMKAMKTEVILEIGAATSRVANVMMEHIQSLVAVVEEKYQDLPSAHAKLRDDFDTHAADLRLHPPVAPKRTRRRPAR